MAALAILPLTMRSVWAEPVLHECTHKNHRLYITCHSSFAVHIFSCFFFLSLFSHPPQRESPQFMGSNIWGLGMPSQMYMSMSPKKESSTSLLRDSSLMREPMRELSKASTTQSCCICCQVVCTSKDGSPFLCQQYVHAGTYRKIQVC